MKINNLHRWLIMLIIIGVFAYHVSDVDHRLDCLEKVTRSSEQIEDEELTVHLRCIECNGIEIFQVLNVGQNNILADYETQYYCDSCKKITDCIFEIQK